MYCLSRRALIMLFGSVLITLIALVALYGAYGAPTENVDHLKDVDDPLAERSILHSRRYKLKQVHAVFRHGQRTPADTYPNDPYLNYTFEPYDWGQLTNNGKYSLYDDIGRWLRHQYGWFVGEVYRAKNVYVQTTGVSRTQMSMMLVLAGLFPPAGTPLSWNERLNWIPIPYFSEPLNQDTLLLVRVSCPRYAEALQEVFSKPEIVALLEQNRELFQNLTKITGMTIATPDDVQSLFSTLKAESEFGLHLPDWTKAYYPNKLLPLTKKSYSLNVYTDELKRLKGGPFLAKTLGEWERVARNESDPSNRKILLYAGHDSTVVNVLSALQVWDDNVLPDYGMMAVLELYKDRETGKYGVVVSRKKLGSDPDILTIPGCRHFCPLDQLKQLLKSTITTDFRKDCVPQDPDTVEPPPQGP